MPHRFPVREIALQAGVSEATVDRVLHGRPGVRPGTVLQVEQAIAELDAQRTQLRLSGRRFMLDVVMETPQRFSALTRRSLEAELPALRPAVFRARYRVAERWALPDLIAELDGIARRGSHGVLLKAPDVPEVAEAIGRLARARIPVVTFVTDVPASLRLAYVGLDNRAAGATAAYLLARLMHGRSGSVLAMTSGSDFRGESEREAGFAATLARIDPDRPIVEIVSDGLDETARRRTAAALAAHDDLAAVYSIGGGNRGLLAAFDAAGRECAAFVAHDLTPDDVELLEAGRISVVLHHDLRADLRDAARALMGFHGALPEFRPRPASVAVVTPYNLPAR
ncbi:MAG: LacI family DNA-binding transcriptional regulator [Gordonia sp. (in: high G+C Gram-positive bacteria)]|uniref:LacI family DNA-binding transcriptional regulator n=1 Tax=Gordonia sp. (in: high G+C Gram-positive bacteria) TaxID=84139 RepID=UPI0039E2EC10